MSKHEEMKKIKDEIVALSSSPLYSYRSENNYFPVIGEGSHDAKIMFIGEAPGLNEAKTGRPFCGRAGKVLDDLLLSIGIPRSDVYITNIVKDRPPENRDPFPDEIKIYAPFLERQIEIIKPKVIATLGRYSMKYIMEKFDLADLLGTIGTLHGKPLEKEVIWGKLTILPLYHPAVAVYNSNMLTALKEDFKKLKEFV